MCNDHDGIVQSSFSAFETLCALLLIPLSAQLWLFSLSFSRMLYRWSLMVCSLFGLASFTWEYVPCVFSACYVTNARVSPHPLTHLTFCHSPRTDRARFMLDIVLSSCERTDKISAFILKTGVPRWVRRALSPAPGVSLPARVVAQVQPP